eukprot:maker-scaffold214_size254108-snap-gene-0.14 protein:Tk01527 transcript:maker-scaffold214_size254108-snap-gene-0.14-mRNA-1 annotation:"hypothetical protein TcasGA2_TC005971"
MNSKPVLFSLAVCIFLALGAESGRVFILDDGEYENLRHRRDIGDAEGSQDSAPAGSAAVPSYSRLQPRLQAEERSQQPSLVYDPIPPVGNDQDTQASSHKYKKEGIVGPVYTFVKTDEYAHVKWGVRHVAGKKYAGHH